MRAKMINPFAILLPASGILMTVNRLSRSTRIIAPAMVPAYPPLPPAREVPPITTAAID